MNNHSTPQNCTASNKLFSADMSIKQKLYKHVYSLAGVQGMKGSSSSSTVNLWHTAMLSGTVLPKYRYKQYSQTHLQTMIGAVHTHFTVKTGVLF